MPQLDINTFISQIFWLFIAYVFLYLFVSKYITRVVFDIKNDREEKILADTKKTEIFLSESKDIENEVLSLKRDAKNEELRISEDAKRRFLISSQEANAKFKRKTQKAIRDYRVSVDEELLNLDNKVQDLHYFHACFLFKKLVNKKISEDMLKKMVK